MSDNIIDRIPTQIKNKILKHHHISPDSGFIIASRYKTKGVVFCAFEQSDWAPALPSAFTLTLRFTAFEVFSESAACSLWMLNYMCLC